MKGISSFITNDTQFPPYLPYPRFLLRAGLTQTAKLVYAVLLDRAQLSLSNGWQDDTGQVYLVFALSKIADTVDKGPSTVKNALNELETAKLIERRRQGGGLPNRIYVKLPDSQEIGSLTAKKLAVTGPENWPSDRQKTGPQMARKLAPNNLSNNNLNNNLKGVTHARARGRYANVVLTEDEYLELQAEIPGLDELIEDLSSYMKSSGKAYAGHAATLRRWARKDAKKKPDYSCNEGESL